MTKKIESEAFEQEDALKTINALRGVINVLNERIKAKDIAMDEVIDILTYIKETSERIKNAHKEAINHLLVARKATLDQVRLNIAAEKGLPIEMAEQLEGETPEELEVNADKLLASLKN